MYRQKEAAVPNMPSLQIGTKDINKDKNLMFDGASIL